MDSNDIMCGNEQAKNQLYITHLNKQKKSKEKWVGERLGDGVDSVSGASTRC